jgi:glutamyl-Q tRNA(Asp) synthetase
MEPHEHPRPLSSSAYVGRFAPSPTGPLHFGSLVAAVGSYLEARRRGGRWLLRMEDLDPPREEPGAADDILRTLERYGFEWDDEIVYQSARAEAYEAALAELDESGMLYACRCSRKRLEQTARRGDHGWIYPGTCAQRAIERRGHYALRVRTHDEPLGFEDALQGHYVHRLRSQIGDFVVKRADGYYAYQLAIVVDDAWQGVTEVVRGADLLDSTPRQIHLQRLLGLPIPRHLHLPVAVDAEGQKLSKQTGARALPARDPSAALVRALEFLGQSVPPQLARSSPAAVWAWAREGWNPANLPARRQIPVADRA